MTEAAVPALLARLRGLVARHLGLLFDSSQNDRLQETLRRLPINETPAAWLARLEHDATPADVDALAAELTVGETYFFRHAEQFDALRTTVLPQWLRRHPSARRLRALCAGCASGEEAYTLAVTLMRSVLGHANVDWDITAFDLNACAIRRAITAHYNAWSLRATPPAWRELWFRQDEAGWTPLPQLRSRVHFQQRQIAAPDPTFWAPESFDVIFCRNMLMYLDPPSLRRAVQHLAMSLAPGGALFLGHAETLHSLTDHLVLQQGAGCFFYQRRADAAEAVPWPFPAADRRVRVPVPTPLGAMVPPPCVKTGSPPPSAFPEPAGSPCASFEAPPEADTRPQSPLRSDQTALLEEALHLVEAGHLDEGLRACTRLMGRPHPPALQAEALFIQALALEERGELPAAEWHHQRAVAKDAGFAMPHLRLGLLARRRGEPVAARRELRRALELLDGESVDRMRRFGGGFERDALRHLCEADLGDHR
jgi:chemotaxis protein methyltransferase CheR